jgi:hydrogenase maturation protease
VELCETGTNGLALLDIIRHQDLLIVVDACLGSGPPGLVSLIDPSHIEHVSRGASVHQLGPVEALMIGSRLYPEMMPQRSLLITVDTNDLKEEDESVACEQVIRTIDREIQAWRLEKTQGA